MANYKTKPSDMKGYPPGIINIVGNEAAERFSFYGMKSILVIFMTTYMLDKSGNPAGLSDAKATEYFHNFTTAVYFLPILGAFISDMLWGKYKTILLLSIVYCMGHLALAMDETSTGLLIGLGLIAVGGGGIKPCVTAHVGDQFGYSNKHLMSKIFSLFYFSINLGAASAFLFIPILLKNHGPHIAFGIPGVLMCLATFVFWKGRNKFVHIPPGGKQFLKETFSPEGLKAIGKISIIFICIAPFWSLFDQTGSSWVLQAKKMELSIFGFECLPSQIQSANPIMVMLLIPLFSYAIYPFMGRFFKVTLLRKIALGMFLMVLAFSIPALIQREIDAGFSPSIGWQLLAYLVITASEVMVSISCLEFAYTQSPLKMKSVIMSCFLMSIALGNFFTARVNHYIEEPAIAEKLAGQNYYWFFCIVMLVSAIFFSIIAYFYKEKTYLQQKADAT